MRKTLHLFSLFRRPTHLRSRTRGPQASCSSQLGYKRPVQGAILGVFLFLASCQSPPVASIRCENMDWFEMGRQDGAQGLPEGRFLSYGQVCNDLSGTSNETLYTSGHAAGLADFCSWKNGIELGRLGEAVPEICTEILQKSLAIAIRLGHQLSTIQSQQQDIGERLARAQKRLQTDSLASEERERLRREIAQLRSSHAANNRQLKELEGQVNAQVF